MAAQGYRAGVCSLSVAPSVRSPPQKLEAAGFHTRGDLENIGPVDLAREAELTHEEALGVLRETNSRLVAQAAALPAPTTALELLLAERARRHIVTQCAELDTLLGGGVAPGEITELCGGPGLGKTQLAIQLAVNVQLPLDLGGLDGEALYVDTEGSLMCERVLDVACGAGALLRARAQSHGSEAMRASFAQAAASWMPEACLQRIHVYRAHDAPTQAALCCALPALVAARPKVKLIVLDSVAFHYRQGVENYAQRARALAHTFGSLLRLAASQGIAVVVTNQVTTKPGASDAAGSRLAPALGESFAHAATTRVLLYWQARGRTAMLFKSPRRARGTAAYAVTSEGVRSARPLKRPGEQADAADAELY